MLFHGEDVLSVFQSKRFLCLTRLESTVVQKVMQELPFPRLGLFSLRRTEEVQRSRKNTLRLARNHWVNKQSRTLDELRFALHFDAETPVNCVRLKMQPRLHKYRG